MLFTEKLAEKNKRMLAPPVTAAFLGDSVTHGCFELIGTPGGGFDCIYDQQSAYHNLLKNDLALVFPQAPLHIINAGIGGDNITGGLRRLDRDVLRFAPDLVVVAYGLNDAGGGFNGIDAYKTNLSHILTAVKSAGAETIFMTENMMATYVAPEVQTPSTAALAERIVETQNSGVLEAYFKAAAEVCADHSVSVCDCYAQWKKMHGYGCDVTRLLSNYLNHPIRQLHSIFSNSLFDMIMS